MSFDISVNNDGAEGEGYKQYLCFEYDIKCLRGNMILAMLLFILQMDIFRGDRADISACTKAMMRRRTRVKRPRWTGNKMKATAVRASRTRCVIQIEANSSTGLLSHLRRTTLRSPNRRWMSCGRTRRFRANRECSQHLLSSLE